MMLLPFLILFIKFESGLRVEGRESKAFAEMNINRVTLMINLSFVGNAFPPVVHSRLLTEPNVEWDKRRQSGSWDPFDRVHKRKGRGHPMLQGRGSVQHEKGEIGV